jgi:hypothetical protein
MRKAVVQSIRCTHFHLEAFDCAFLQAKAIAFLAKQQDVFSFSFNDLVHMLVDLSTVEVVKEKLSTVLEKSKTQIEDLDILKTICQPNTHGKIFQLR